MQANHREQLKDEMAFERDDETVAMLANRLRELDAREVDVETEPETVLGQLRNKRRHLNMMLAAAMAVAPGITIFDEPVYERKPRTAKDVQDDYEAEEKAIAKRNRKNAKRLENLK